MPLVEVDVDGDIYGFVVDGPPRAVTLSDGSTRIYEAGADLDQMPVRSVSIYGDGVSSDSSLNLTLPLDLVDLWERRDRSPIQRVQARVYWWPNGSILRERHQVFTGVLRSPEIIRDADGQGTISATLSPNRRGRDVPFPPTLIGDEERFSGPADDSVSQAVPVLYGTCLGVPLFAVSDVTADPIRLLIAGHPITSTSVDISRDGAVVSAGASVSTDIDGRGQAYSYVEVSKANYDAGANLYAPTVDGHNGPGGDAVDRLGDVLEHLWRTYSPATWGDLDHERVSAARVVLNRIRVGLMINAADDQGSVLRFIESRLAGQFPVATGWSGGRYGWDALLLPEGTPEASDSLTYGRDTHERVSIAETSADDVLTEIDVAYAQDGYEGGPSGHLHMTRSNNGDLRRAESVWGPSPVERLSIPDAATPGAAYIVGTDTARKRSRVRTRVEYAACDARLFDLPLLSTVLVTDAEIGWVDEACMIEAARPRFDGACDLTLITWDGQ